jgi:hypothetical protein
MRVKYICLMEGKEIERGEGVIALLVSGILELTEGGFSFE